MVIQLEESGRRESKRAKTLEGIVQGALDKEFRGEQVCRENFLGAC